jgi:hypothetical protein
VGERHHGCRPARLHLDRPPDGPPSPAAPPPGAPAAPPGPHCLCFRRARRPPRRPALPCPPAPQARAAFVPLPPLLPFLLPRDDPFPDPLPHRFLIVSFSRSAPSLHLAPCLALHHSFLPRRCAYRFPPFLRPRCHPPSRSSRRTPHAHFLHASLPPTHARGAPRRQCGGGELFEV